MRSTTNNQWRPSADELAGILDEMRPIIADFTRRAATFLANAAAEQQHRPAGFGAIC